MTQIKKHPPGTFCWADLATTDAEAAKGFYTALFGWTASDLPSGEVGTYTMLQKDRKNVGALFAMNEEMRKQAVPPHWLSYVSVESADRSTEKAEQLGGKVIRPPFNVPFAGRTSIVQDPTGANFALWQPKAHRGAQLLNEPGALCWNELCTKDLEAAARFYTALFGWTVKKLAGAMGQPYTEFLLGERHLGGMLEIQESWGAVPPNWGVYFAVDTCDASLEKAKALDGRAEMEPMEVEQAGRFVVLQDPQGAHFSVIQMTGVPG